MVGDSNPVGLRDGPFSTFFQTCPGAHPASIMMNTGAFSRGLYGRGEVLTTCLLSLRLWASPATPVHEPSWLVKGWRIHLPLRKVLKRNRMANGVLCDVVHTLCQGVIYFINVTGFAVNVYMSFHPYRPGMYVVLCVHFYRSPICLTALNWDSLYEISFKSDNT